MKTSKKSSGFTQSIVSLFVSVLLLLMCAIPVAANDSAPVGAVISESPAPAPAPVPTGTIQDYVDAMQPGYNLGNTFDAFGGDWVQEVQDTVTQDFINEIARQGFKSIRIPTTWEWGGHTGAAPDYTVDPAWMNRIQQVVDWSLDAGLYVMINLHHDNIRWINQMPTNHDAVLAKYNALWTQIADRFKNHSNKLMFESVNEPQFVNVDNAKQNELLDELNTSFFHIVRASGGANDVRPLVLPTLVTNGVQLDMDYLASTMAKLNDKNLIATIHFYGFWPFGINIAGYSTFEHNGDTAKDIDGLAARAYNTFIAKGVPVVIGEFGVFGWDSWGAGDDVPEKGEANKFFEYSTYVFKQNKMTHMLWDNTSRFDRSTYKWNDQDTYNYIMAGLEGRSSTAESDLIFIKKGAPAQDTVMHLNLNGNNLTGITAGNESLTAGSDYVVNGNDLVFKAGFITKLIQSAQLGEVAVLKAHFDKGVDWTFHVIYNDTPVQQNAEGSNTNFAIPTAFNGDRLATMEAVYTKGGNAGPANWTSYKAIAESYKISYATNEILLTENFFNEVTSGDEVVLTFYFRSGATTQYKVTKNGTSVTGKAPSAPSVSITSYEEGQAINSNSPQLDWTFLDAYDGDVQAAYQVQASSNGWETIGMDSGELAGASNSYKLSGLADGNWSIKVRAKNNHGTWSEWAYRSLIIDTVAPTLNVVLDKETLWPANNSLVSVKATVKAEDGLSQVESVVLLSITPNIAVDSYKSMVQKADFGTFDTEFMLLAKKAQGTEPLVYTINYRAEDRAGNVTVTSVTVTVPHG